MLFKSNLKRKTMKNTTLTSDPKRAEKIYFALYFLFVALFVLIIQVINVRIY